MLWGECRWLGRGEGGRGPGQRVLMLLFLLEREYVMWKVICHRWIGAMPQWHRCCLRQQGMSVEVVAAAAAVVVILGMMVAKRMI